MLVFFAKIINNVFALLTAYFKTKSRMTISHDLFVCEIEDISFKSFVKYVCNYIKNDEKRIDSMNRTRSNKLQTMQTKLWFQ